MMTDEGTGFVPAPEPDDDCGCGDPGSVAAQPEAEAAASAQKPKGKKKRLRYIGPDYAGRIALPHFNRPGDPKRWDEATIRSYLEKWPDLDRFFGT